MPSDKIAPDTAGEGELETGIADRKLLNQEDDSADPELDDPESNEESDDESTDDSEDGGSDETEDSDDAGEEEPEEEEEESDEESGEDESEDIESDSPDALIKDLAKSGMLKKHPELRAMISENKEYQQYFATPEEAKVAQEQVTLFNNMQETIVKGDAEPLLKVLKATNEESLVEFSHSFIDAIGKLDPKVYSDILTAPVRKVLQAAFIDGKKAQNKNLFASAIYLHEYIFGDREVGRPIEERKGLMKKTPEMEKFETERQQFEQKKRTDFGKSVDEVIIHTFKSELVKDLKRYTSISDYTRGKIVDEIISKVDGKLTGDPRHKSSIESLFKQAQSAGYTGDWKSRIVSSWLHRGRAVLPEIRKKVLQEAGVKGIQNGVEPKRLSGISNRSSESTGDSINWDKVDKSKLSDRDILAGRTTPRKK
jgi:hypothetical protein